MSLKERLRSWPVWLSLLGAVGMLLNTFGVFAKLGIDSTTWDVCVNAIGTVLVMFGVLNNPTDRNHF